MNYKVLALKIQDFRKPMLKINWKPMSTLDRWHVKGRPALRRLCAPDAAVSVQSAELCARDRAHQLCRL